MTQDQSGFQAAEAKRMSLALPFDEFTRLFRERMELEALSLLTFEKSTASSSDPTQYSFHFSVDKTRAPRFGFPEDLSPEKAMQLHLDRGVWAGNQLQKFMRRNGFPNAKADAICCLFSTNDKYTTPEAVIHWLQSESEKAQKILSEARIAK